jgi:hypothetical protein
VRNKIEPATLELFEQPLRSVHGLPGHVRKLIGEEVAQSLVGKCLGDTLIVRFPDGKTVALWRCRGCGSWWKRFRNWCPWCESWAKRVRELKLAESKAKSRSKRRKGGAS